MGIWRNLRFLVNALRMRFLSKRPIFLSHMITSDCDCRCETCNYWSLEKKDEMTISEIRDMLNDAYSTGMTDYIVWGGEPLLRRDLPEAIKHADSLGMDVSIITNGTKLPERIEEIADHLYALIVSIDHAEPEVHDRIRNKTGVYQSALNGIRKAKSFGDLNIYINCVVTEENVDSLEEIAGLAKELGVKISFEMMEVIEGYNEHLALDGREKREACLELIGLKNRGYSIANSIPYLESVAKQEEYNCPVPKVLVTVKWNGEVRICSTISEKLRPNANIDDLGNVREETFSDIFESPEYQKYVSAARDCSKCDLSYPRESAHLYSFDGRAISNFISRIL